MDIEDGILLLEKLMKYYNIVEEQMIEMKFGAGLNATVVNKNLEEIKEKAKFNLGTFDK